MEVNIVQLVENHPVSNLSDSYRDTFASKIYERFCEPEQKLFILHFYCYLHHNKSSDFVVDLDRIWEWMGFTSKQNARFLLEKYFKNGVDYTLVHTTMVLSSTEEKWGGHNLKKIMLTVRCFKSLCLKAQTKKASEIHDYYMKLEEVLYEVIEEETTDLKTKLIEHKRLLDEQALQMKLTPEQEKHKVLLREFGIIDGSLVYVVRVATQENGYVIKIGESRRGIRARWNEFRKHYGEHVIILDCFLVNRSADFEKFLHSHPHIRPNKVTNLQGYEKENELFLIGQNLSYATVLDIINKNIRVYNYSITDYDKLKTEYDKLQLEYTALKTNPTAVRENEILKEILETNRILLQRVSEVERSQQALLERVNATQTKTTTKFGLPDTHLGPRLQKINPNHLQQIIKVYESVTECIQEDPRIKRPSVNKAIRENTVYCGFRWHLVDRSMDPTVAYHMEPTKETKIQSLGYIAQVDKEKTHILHVYLDRKTAATKNGYKSSSALDNAVKSHTLKDGYYYMLFQECEPSWKSTFQAKNGNFILYKQGVGRFDKEGRLINEYICKDDCVKRVRISQKSLAKVLDKNITYDGFYFRSLGEKLSI